MTNVCVYILKSTEYYDQIFGQIRAQFVTLLKSHLRDIRLFLRDINFLINVFAC